jgi:hypothetical protein
MNRKLTSAAALVAGGLAFWLGGPVSAQQEKTGKANWLTDGGDSQRTSWQRNEKLIGKATAKDIKLLWTLQTDNQPRQLHNLFAPLIVSDVATAAGPREIAILAGVSDNIYGIDVEKGTQIWKRHFDSTFTEPTEGRGYGPLCPGGLTATPVVAALDAPGKYKVYAISWDGRLRQLDAATGADLAPAEPFLPPNGKPYALNLVNNVLTPRPRRVAAAIRISFTVTTSRRRRSEASVLEAAASGLGSVRRSEGWHRLRWQRRRRLLSWSSRYTVRRLSG